jgi:hypothetical protein
VTALENKPVKFKFAFGEDVTITALNVSGKIMARGDRGNHHDYRVVYWSDGSRKDDWLIEHEIEKKKR